MRVGNGKKSQDTIQNKTSLESINAKANNRTYKSTKKVNPPQDKKVEKPKNINAESVEGHNKTKGKKPVKQLQPLSGGKIFLMVLVGMLFSFVIFLIVYGLYMNNIKYPPMMETITEKTGAYALRVWEKEIDNLDSDIADLIGEDSSYLASEIAYANEDKYKEEFLKKIVATVEYEPRQVEALNKYGNPMVDRNDRQVFTDDTVEVGDKVTLKYVDYKKIKLDEEKISELMKESELSVGDVDYSNKLVDVFCQYICGLKTLPTREDAEYTPNLTVKDSGRYSLTSEEDIYLDKLLFSSEDFYDLLERFSIIAGASGEDNQEWIKWYKLSDEEKKKVEEPSKTIDELQPTEEWLKWSKEENNTLDEPLKYNPKDIISMKWCGSYFLQNEHTELDSSGNPYKSKINAMVGNGTLESPAGLDTDVITTMTCLEEDNEGNLKKVNEPIRLRLVEFGVSQDALDWFESKDERNRGIDIKSEIQYAYYIFEVTNLSGKELTVYDNSSLSDKNINLSSRTGTMYGLQDSVTLKPDETGRVESWSMSTELNLKYLIWGKDFAREKDVVWFRVLAGDIDDPSEDKGVYLNKSRYTREIENDDDY